MEQGNAENLFLTPTLGLLEPSLCLTEAALSWKGDWESSLSYSAGETPYGFGIFCHGK